MNWLAFSLGILIWLSMPILFHKPEFEDAPHGFEKEWFAYQTARHWRLTISFVALVAAYIVSLFVR